MPEPQAPAAATAAPARPAAPTGAPVRSSAVDAVRVLATLAVVAGHTYLTPWVGPYIFTWHVPVFFVLSGYLWTHGRGVADEVRKRARTLLVPYFCWLALVTTAWVWYVDHADRRLPPEFFVNLVQGGSAIARPYSAFWFITAMFVATVLARLIEKVTGRAAAWSIAAVGVVGFVLGTRHAEAMVSIWWAAGLAVPCMLFLAAGMALRDVRTWIRGPFLVGTALIYVGWRMVDAGAISLNIKYGEFGTPVQSVVVGIVIPIGMILVAEGVLVGRFREIRWISVLAQTSMPVILGHTLVLAVLAGRGVAPFTSFLTAAILPWCFGLAALRVRPLRAILL